MNLVKEYSPTSLLLLTRRNKRGKLDSMTSVLEKSGYIVDTAKSGDLLFKGKLSHVNQLRKELELSREAYWNDPSYFGTVATKKEILISFPEPKSIEKIDLGNTPIINISEVKLNEHQKKASLYSKSPSVILGSAGSGKSIVICEKIFNTVKQYNYSPNLKILVTTFNILLIEQLVKWLEQSLDNDKAKKSEKKKVVYFKLNGSSISNITLMHFDILPNRIGSSQRGWKDANDTRYEVLMNEFIKEVKIENKITNDRYDNVFKE